MQIDIPPRTRVLVTGATGYTGRWLVKKLVAADLDVVAIARASSNLEPLADLPITWHRGEVYDADIINAASEGVTYVFHVAAAFRDAQSTEQDYRNVHLVSTQLLVAAMEKQATFKRFVHVSTMGVHGHIANPPGSEQSPYAPGDLYQSTKVEGEQWLINHAAYNNVPYSIIRPCAIYGPGERRLLKLFKMAKKPIFPILGKGQCWYHLVHVEDLCNSIILAATAPGALGEAFISGSAEPIRLEEMAKIMADEFSSKLRIIRIPITPFFIAADICEAICKPFGISPPIYRRRVAFYSKDRYFDTSKLRNILGYEPIYSNEEGIRESAKWYQENRWL